jgi:hypothetical protein
MGMRLRLRLRMRAIYKILNYFNLTKTTIIGGISLKKTLCMATLIGVVTFSIEGDYQIISKHLPQPMAHQLAPCSILHKDIRLVKKRVRG